jgi:hypothetical protein
MMLDPALEARLRSAKEKLWDAHSSDPNFTGVGIGFRHRAGEWTDEPVAFVLLRKKRPAAHVSRRRLVPTTVDVDGVACAVDVHQTGPIGHGATPSSAPADVRTLGQPITELMRPPRQGASIGNLGLRKTGTLGCFVQDNTDRTICILSANHVLAVVNQAPPGSAIVQPGTDDGGSDSGNEIAQLKRFVPLVNEGSVDAAIAQLENQTSGSGYTTAVAHDLMAAISPSHPAVGMCIANDTTGSSYLTPVDTVLAALNVSLLGGPGAVALPELNTNIEKVGRTSGYTSCPIRGIGVDLFITYGDQIMRIRDLFWATQFNIPGDSGSIACVGGDGDTPVDPSQDGSTCPTLGAAAEYYNVPLTDDEALSDQVRDDFLALSKVGRLMIAITYANADTAIARWTARVGGQGQAIEQAYAPSYYAKYHDYVATLLGDPTSTAVVTDENIHDIQTIISGEIEVGEFTKDEAKAASYLFNNVIVQTSGMNRQQLLDFMNDDAVYQTVYDQLAAVPTIELTVPVYPDHH